MGLFVFCSCQFLLILFGIYLAISWLTKTPFYPSSPKKLGDLLGSGEIKLNGKNFMDIGSGDGRFVIWAARHGYIAAGIEFNPFLSLLSKFKITLLRINNKAKIYNKNFMNHDFSEYDIIYMYIFSEHMDKLKGKLFNELSPGSVIITNTFKFTDLKPDLEIDRYKIYYKK